MKERNLTQADILRKCEPYCKKYGVTMSKSALSQYCSGKYEPDQRRLTILSMALDVSEAWLMGFDVRKEAQNNIKAKVPTSESALNEYEEKVLYLLRTIPEDKREDFLKYLQAAINMMK